MAIRRIGVLTSGGDAPGMNAAIRAAVRTALGHEIEVIGVKEGYKGLAHNQNGILDIPGGILEVDSIRESAYLIRMTAGSVGDIVQRGGTILRSARLPEFQTDPNVRKAAYATLEKAEIDALIVLGGDGSYNGADVIHRESGIPVAGVPCTIDNDMPYSDFSIGFDTAVNTAIHSINNLRDTMGSHGRVCVVEVMGRGCGDIAIYSGMAAGAEAILIPEIKRTEAEWMDYIIKKLTFSQSRGKRFGIIVMAEGVRRDNTVKFGQLADLLDRAIESLDRGLFSQVLDAEMQAALRASREGEFTPESIAVMLEKRIGTDARGMSLAHTQRGGSPTASDRILASRLSARAVELLLAGERNAAIGVRDGAIIHMPIREALATPRKVRHELIDLADLLAM